MSMMKLPFYGHLCQMIGLTNQILYNVFHESLFHSACLLHHSKLPCENTKLSVLDHRPRYITYHCERRFFLSR